MQKIKGVVERIQTVTVEEVADIWVTVDGRKFERKADAQRWEDSLKYVKMMEKIKWAELPEDFNRFYLVNNESEVYAILSQHYYRYGTSHLAIEKLVYPSIVCFVKDTDNETYETIYVVEDVTTYLDTLYSMLKKIHKEEN